MSPSDTRSSTSRAGQAGPKATYGRLFEWLAYSTPVVTHGSILEILREHILNHTAIEPGTFLLGREVLERRCHSVYSLSLATKMHPKRLRKLLEKRGDIPPDCSDAALNLLVFPAKETELFCGDFLDSVPQNKLQIELGGSRNQVTSLYQEGVVKSVIDQTEGDNLGRIDFPRCEINRILTEIQNLPIMDAELEVVGLTTATKRMGMTTGRVPLFLFCECLRRGYF